LTEASALSFNRNQMICQGSPARHASQFCKQITSATKEAEDAYVRYWPKRTFRTVKQKRLRRSEAIELRRGDAATDRSKLTDNRQTTGGSTSVHAGGLTGDSAC
jgi:hypothetical protein